MPDAITPLPPAPAPASKPVPAAKPATVDAVLVPHEYPAAVAELHKLQARNEEFAPVLWANREKKGVRHPNSPKRVFTRKNPLLAKDLITPCHDSPPCFFPETHRYFPKQDRYEWTDRGDGVMYGVLRPDSPEDEDAAN